MAGATRLDGVLALQTAGAEQVDKLAAGLAKVGDGLDSLSKKSEKVNQSGFEGFAAKFRAGIEAPAETAGRTLEKLLNGLGPLGAGLVGAAGAFAAFANAGAAAAEKYGKLGDEYQDMAQVMATTAETAAKMKFGFEYTGGGVDKLSGIMRKLSQEVMSGDGALEKFGIQTRKLGTDELRAMSDILLQLVDRLRAVPEGAARNTLAYQMLGRSAVQALPDLMELAEGMRKAEDFGLAPSEKEINKWAEWHKQLTTAKWAIEALRREVEQPLVSSFMVMVNGIRGDTSDFGETLLKAFQEQRGKLSTEEGDKLLEKMVNTTFLTPSQYRAAKDSIDQSPAERERVGLAAREAGVDLNFGEFKLPKDRLREALKAPGTGDAVEVARGRLQDLQEELQGLKELGKGWAELEATVAKIEAAKAEVIAAERNAKRSQEVMAKGRELAAYRRKVRGQELGPASKAFADVEGKGWNRESQEEWWALAFEDASFELRKEEQYLPLNIPQKAADQWKQQAEAAEKELDQSTSKFVQTWLAKVKPLADANRQIDDILFGSERSEIMARSGKAARLAELAAGPGQEAGAIVSAYRERLRLAQELYNLDIERAGKEADQQKQRVDMAKAEADLHRERYEAEIDAEVKLAELRRRGLDEYKSLVVGGLQAALSGGDGAFGAFLKSQGLGVVSKLAGNAAGMTYGAVQGKFTLPGQGTVENPTWFGKLLSGTPLGLDPLKSATDANTLATVENTAALQAVGASGPGGGVGSQIRGGLGAWLATRGGAADTGYTSDGVQKYSPEYYDNEGRFMGGGASPSSTAAWGKYLGYGAAVAGGGFGIYSGIESGGARGALTAGGSAAAMAGAILPLIDKSLKMAGPIGMAVGMGLGLLTSFLPNRREQREREMEEDRAARAFTAPVGQDYVSDIYGRTIDYNYRGGMRPIVIYDQRQYSAVDAPSFVEWGKRNPGAVASVLTSDMVTGNGEDVLGTLQERIG